MAERGQHNFSNKYYGEDIGDLPLLVFMLVGKGWQRLHVSAQKVCFAMQMLIATGLCFGAAKV